MLKMENRSAWIRWLPGLLTFHRYQITWLVRDVVAGVVLATMLVPVGIAYAVASGLLGICGGYMNGIALTVPMKRSILVCKCKKLRRYKAGD
jgi:MFS superfamily sulfate permease-like transporter